MEVQNPPENAESLWNKWGSMWAKKSRPHFPNWTMRQPLMAAPRLEDKSSFLDDILNTCLLSPNLPEAVVEMPPVVVAAAAVESPKSEECQSMEAAYDDASTHYHLPDDVHYGNSCQVRPPLMASPRLEDKSSFLDDILNTCLLSPNLPEAVVEMPLVVVAAAAVDSPKSEECPSMEAAYDDASTHNHLQDDVYYDNSCQDVWTDNSHGFHQNGLCVPTVEHPPRRHDHSPTHESTRSLLDVVNVEPRLPGEFTNDVNGNNLFQVVGDGIRPTGEATPAAVSHKPLQQTGDIWLQQDDSATNRDSELPDDLPKENFENFSADVMQGVNDNECLPIADDVHDDKHKTDDTVGSYNVEPTKDQSSPSLDQSPEKIASPLKVVDAEIRPVEDVSAAAATLQQELETEEAAQPTQQLQQEEDPVSLPPPALQPFNFPRLPRCPHTFTGAQKTLPMPISPWVQQLQQSTQTTPKPTKRPPTAEKIKENNLSYERYARHLALERDASVGLIETQFRLHDHLMPSRRQLTTTALNKLVKAAPDTRALSHDGRWNTVDRNPSWFNMVFDPDEKLDDLASLSDSDSTESLDSVYSFVADEVEKELELLVADNWKKENQLCWQRGFVVRACARPNKPSYEFEIFTLQGFQRFKTTQKEDLTGRRVKFVVLCNGEAVVRRSSRQRSSLFNTTLRISRKRLSLCSTAIVAYRHPTSRGGWLMWCDDIGLIEVSQRIVSKHDRNIWGIPMMAPLKLLQIKMETDYYDEEERVKPRNWQVEKMNEVADTYGRLHESAWPRLAQRVDDLQWISMKKNGMIALHSRAFPERFIHCKKDQWLRRTEDERSRSYRALKFAGVIVPHMPHEGKKQEKYWRCLMLAPISEIADNSQDRIFDLRPVDGLMRARRKGLPREWEQGDPPPCHVMTFDVETRNGAV